MNNIAGLKTSAMRYSVSVRFNANEIQVAGDSITIGIKSKPEGGKANRELVIKLAKYFDVPVSNVRIVAGLTSRKKIVEIG